MRMSKASNGVWPMSKAVTGGGVLSAWAMWKGLGGGYNIITCESISVALRISPLGYLCLTLRLFYAVLFNFCSGGFATGGFLAVALQGQVVALDGDVYPNLYVLHETSYIR